MLTNSYELLEMGLVTGNIWLDYDDGLDHNANTGVFLLIILPLWDRDNFTNFANKLQKI